MKSKKLVFTLAIVLMIISETESGIPTRRPEIPTTVVQLIRLTETVPPYIYIP